MGPGHAIIVLSDLAVAFQQSVYSWQRGGSTSLLIFSNARKALPQNMKFDTYDSSGKALCVMYFEAEDLTKTLSSREFDIKRNDSLHGNIINKKRLFSVTVTLIDNNFLFYTFYVMRINNISRWCFKEVKRKIGKKEKKRKNTKKDF